MTGEKAKYSDRRVSRLLSPDHPSPLLRVPFLTDAALKLHTKQTLGFDRKFHRQLQKHILAEAVNNQRDCIFLRDPALLQIEQLLLADFRGRSFMLHRRHGTVLLTVGGAVDVQFSSLRGEVVELPGGVVVVNDCYNANPMSMRAALDHLAESPAERPDTPCWARWPSWARTRRAITARSASTRRRAGWTSSCRWAGGPGLHRRLRRGDAAGGDARGGRRAARGGGPSRRPRAREGLAFGRAGAGAQLRMLGEIVMAGSASLLICMFLGPRFIDYLPSSRSSAGRIQEGPAGHHGEARARPRWAASRSFSRSWCRS